MLRRWFSGFIRNNKEKIEKIIKAVALIGVAFFIIYSIVLSLTKNNSITKKTGEIYAPTETIISGSNINEEEYEEDSNLVDTFINYCNEKKVNEAYQLLTDECKENLYTTLEDFQKNYCNKYFDKKRTYSLQSWINTGNYTTYQIRITDDILSTGDYTNSEKYQDYITIVDNNGNKKLNINGYIGREEINKVTDINGISIKVCNVERYMDYEKYFLEITNNTNNTLLLNDMQNVRHNLTLNTSEDDSYPVNINSINEIKLMVLSGQTKQIKINFTKKYTLNKDSKYIKFSNVILNYDEFITDKVQYNNFTEIKVQL